MAFSVNDFQDLARLLRDHPEWRDEMRRLVLTEELLGLPALHARTDERLDRLTARVDDLTQRVDDLTQRVGDLTQRVGDLTQRVDDLARQMVELARRVDDLTRQVRELGGRVDALTLAVQGIQDRLSSVLGDYLESRFHRKVATAFRDVARKARVLGPDDLDALLDPAVDDMRLSQAEADSVADADIVARGRAEDGSDVYLVVEVSFTIDVSDVTRAASRAAVLARAGLSVVAVVAGEHITGDADEVAAQRAVRQVLNRRVADPAA